MSKIKNTKPNARTILENMPRKGCETLKYPLVTEPNDLKDSTKYSSALTFFG